MINLSQQFSLFLNGASLVHVHTQSARGRKIWRFATHAHHCGHFKLCAGVGATEISLCCLALVCLCRVLGDLWHDACFALTLRVVCWWAIADGVFPTTMKERGFNKTHVFFPTAVFVSPPASNLPELCVLDLVGPYGVAMVELRRKWHQFYKSADLAIQHKR